jgi:integrase
MSGVGIRPPRVSKAQLSFEKKVLQHEALVEKFSKKPIRKKDPLVWKESLAAVSENLKSSLSRTTGANYQYWWSKFEKFCVDSLRPSMPFTAVTAAAFLSHLAESSVGLGGVDGARSALRYYWGTKFPDRFPPTDSQEVRAVVMGVKRRFQKPAAKRRPLMLEDFSKILVSVTEGGGCGVIRICALRFAAQLAVMYSTFSRFEEASALKVGQVKEEDGKFVVDFLKGKQYQFGEARLSMMPGQPHLPVDPVAVLRAYLARLVGMGAGRDTWLFPAFSCSTGGGGMVIVDQPASYNCVLKQLKVACSAAGVSGCPSEYGLHSMRRGAATTAVNNGCSDHVVRKQMRVSLQTVQTYASLNKSKLCEAPNALFL